MLRRARPADLGAIMAIERATFTTDAWPEHAMLAELEGAHTYYLVVVDDARPDVAVAYAGLLAPSGSGQGDIQTIAVDAAARGRGPTELFLEVRADNPVARTLYESHGFTEIGVRRGYYQPDGVDAIAMRLDVPPAIARPAASGPVTAPVEPAGGTT